MDLNIRTKTIRCLKENTRENLFDLRLGKDFFLDMAPRPSLQKKKIIN